jgi:hypothetical protein
MLTDIENCSLCFLKACIKIMTGVSEREAQIHVTRIHSLNLTLQLDFLSWLQAPPRTLSLVHSVAGFVNVEPKYLIFSLSENRKRIPMFWRNMLPLSSGLKYVSSGNASVVYTGWKKISHET